MSSNSMEQARYLMWAKRKQTSLSCNLEISQSNTSSCNDHDSWEEQAFAEDASGHLGGGCCIWPPRSYSCSFCRREFRSAQALGGHMNVHRRDRARLKQSPNPNNDQVLNQNQISIQNPLHHQYPISSQVCAFVYNANPNSDLGVINTSSPISPSTNNPRLLRSTISSSSSPQSWSNNMDQSSKLDHHGDKKISKLMESRCKLKGDNCETSTHHDHNNLPALSLNLVLCNKEEAVIGFKRRKINPPSISSFLKVPSEVDTYNYTQLPSDQLFEVSPQNSIQELDLELRLGDRPKVNY